MKGIFEIGYEINGVAKMVLRFKKSVPIGALYLTYN